MLSIDLKKSFAFENCNVMYLQLTYWIKYLLLEFNIIHNMKINLTMKYIFNKQLKKYKNKDDNIHK